MIEVDAIVIGAGAAGLMCAAQLGQKGKRVLLLDHANKPGKKILMSGGGRCNFTNLNVTPNNYISHNPHFCRSALSRYTPQDFIDLVESYRIAYHEKTLGQLFCDDKAKHILNMLLDQCQLGKVEIKLQTSITAIEKSLTGFELKTDTHHYCCEHLVIASGGLSIPTLGASPFGYKVAQQFDITVWPTRAGLVPFTWSAKDKELYAQLSGISLDCIVKCRKQTFSEAMLFTHRGLSGPAMLQISSYWQLGDVLCINLSPENNIETILNQAKYTKRKCTVKTVLKEYFPVRFLEVWFAENVLSQSIQETSHKQFVQIAQQIHQWQFKPNGTEGYRTAEVTLGGVDCNALSSKTFMAHDVAGLYFIGEVVDVTGWLGGYNFQWAWASAVALAEGMF